MSLHYKFFDQFEVKPDGMFSPDLEEEIRIVIGYVALNPNPFKRTPGSKSSNSFSLSYLARTSTRCPSTTPHTMNRVGR